MASRAGAPFQQIKALVRSEIQSGNWKVGDRIPSELDLAESFGVARMTVNRALRELTEEGTLERVTGVGTFVAEGKPQSNLLMIAHIKDEIAARGHEYVCKVVSKASEPASLEVAAAFGIQVNAPVFHVVCVHLENTRPIQLEDRYVNPVAAPDFIDQPFVEVPPSQYLYDNVSHEGLEIEHVVDAAMPTDEQAELLGMRTTEPCLNLTRRTWSNNIPVTLVKFVHPGNRYRLGSRFRAANVRGQV